ncbi:DUF6573 family protein [Streptomyces mayteni]
MNSSALPSGGSFRDLEVGGDAMRSIPTPPAGSQVEPADGAERGEATAAVVDAYSRADALEDGVLVAVDAELARQAGLPVPVALTAAAHADCVAWSAEDDARKGTCQDEVGRLWDVLNMVRFALRRLRRTEWRYLVELYRVPRPGRARTARRTVLAVEIGPGDSGEPVLTIMLPDES